MKIFKGILFYSIQLVACLVMLEIVAYFFLLHTDNPLYRARRILQYDLVTGWMQRPLLNTIFEKIPLYTDEVGFRTPDNSNQKNIFKFITLGPSSALGWGVDYLSTYSSLVADHFKVKVLNASGIGHSIVQGELVWKKKLAKKNLALTHVFIAYGINDLDKFRFFDSAPMDDKTFFQSSPLALRIDKLDLPFNFPVLISLVAREVLYSGQCDQLIGSIERVSWNDFELTLNSMTANMKSKNIIPVLINTPFYLKTKNPKYNSELILSSYTKVTELAKAGKCQEARAELKIAKSYEPDNILEQVVLFNRKLKDYSLKNGIKYVDAYQVLSIGRVAENFVDPVHPSKLGHQKIASQIIELMMY